MVSVLHDMHCISMGQDIITNFNMHECAHGGIPKFGFSRHVLLGILKVDLYINQFSNKMCPYITYWPDFGENFEKIDPSI